MKRLKILASSASIALSACASQAQNNTPDISQWQDHKDGKFHALSGFVCPNQFGELRFEEAVKNPTNRSGMDVHCKLNDRHGNWITVFLNHDSIRPPIQQHFSEAAQVIRLVHSSDEERPVPVTSNGEDVAEFSIAYRMTPYSMQLLADEEIMDTALWIEQIGGWHVKIRANYFRGFDTAAADNSAKLLEKARTELPNGFMYFGPTQRAHSVTVLPAD